MDVDGSESDDEEDNSKELLSEAEFEQLLKETVAGNISLSEVSERMGVSQQSFTPTNQDENQEILLRQLLSHWTRQNFHIDKDEAIHELYKVIFGDTPEGRVRGVRLSELNKNIRISEKRHQRDISTLVKITPQQKRKAIKINQKDEEATWRKDHSLMRVDEDKIKDSLEKIHFLGDELELLREKRSLIMKNGGTLEYEHWYVKDVASDLVLDFSEEDDGSFLLKIHRINLVTDDGDNIPVDDDIKTFKKTEDVVKRMKEVLGTTNFSLLLRNSEHLVTYIYSGVWTSYQLNREDSIIINRLNPNKQIEMKVDEKPEELLTLNKEHLQLQKKIHDSIPFSACIQNGCDNEISKEENSYNVLILGPTGAGKSTVANHLFNVRNFYPVGPGVKPETRDVHFASGEYIFPIKKKTQNTKAEERNRPVNIFDTPGFGDALIRKDDVLFQYIFSRLKRKVSHLNKVVIIFDKDTTGGQLACLKYWLDMLEFEIWGKNFTFFVSKCDQNHSKISYTDYMEFLTGDSRQKYFELSNLHLPLPHLPFTLDEQTEQVIWRLKREILSGVESFPINFGQRDSEISRWIHHDHVTHGADIHRGNKITQRIPKMRIMRKDVPFKNKLSNPIQPDVLDDTLFLCFTLEMFCDVECKFYFITDKKHSIKLKEHPKTKKWILKIFPEEKVDAFYQIEESFHRSVHVQSRINNLVKKSEFNFSYAFRNSEHVSRYIRSGVWVSYQMTQSGPLRKVLEVFMEESERKFLNVCPKNLSEGPGVKERSKVSRSEFKKTAVLRYIEKEDIRDEFNVVFLGIYGADKNKLINHLFDEEILSSWTDHVYIKGTQLQTRKIKIAATIDLCGPYIEREQLENIIADSLKANLSHVDAVVVVTGGGGRFESGHYSSISRFLKWFNFKENQENFIFIQSTKSILTEEQKDANLQFVLGQLGVRNPNIRSLSLSLDYKELNQLKKFVLEKKGKRIEIPRNFGLISNQRRRLKPVRKRKELDSEADDEVIMAEQVHENKSTKRKGEDAEDVTESKRERVDMDQLTDNFNFSMNFSDGNTPSRTSRASPPVAAFSSPAASSTLASDLPAPTVESEALNRKQNERDEGFFTKQFKKFSLF